SRRTSWPFPRHRRRPTRTVPAAHPGANGRDEPDRSVRRSHAAGLERGTTCAPGGGKGGAMPVKELTGSAPVSVDGVTIDAPGLTGQVVVVTGAGASSRALGDQVPDQIRLAIQRHGGRA